VSDDIAADNLALAQQFAAECERKQRRHHPARRHQQLGPRHGRASAGRSARTRSRTSGSATAASSAATWATLFPDTVRAAVLDGASDPEADRLESSLQQMAGFEASLGDVPRSVQCDPVVPLHNDGDAGAAFDRLMAELEDDPVPSRPAGPTVGRGVATTACPGDVQRGVLAAARTGARRRRRRRRRRSALDSTTATTSARADGSYGDELEAFQVISCADTAERPTTEELRRRECPRSSRWRRAWCRPTPSRVLLHVHAPGARPAHGDHR
jgi:hypothetical protein